MRMRMETHLSRSILSALDSTVNFFLLFLTHEIWVKCKIPVVTLTFLIHEYFHICEFLLFSYPDLYIVLSQIFICYAKA